MKSKDIVKAVPDIILLKKAFSKITNLKIFATSNFKTKCELYICCKKSKFLIGTIILKLLTSNILYSFAFNTNRNYLKDSAVLFNTYSWRAVYPLCSLIRPSKNWALVLILSRSTSIIICQPRIFKC